MTQRQFGCLALVIMLAMLVAVPATVPMGHCLPALTPLPSPTWTARPSSPSPTPPAPSPTARPTLTRMPSPALGTIRVRLGDCYALEPGPVLEARLIGRETVELVAWVSLGGDATIYDAPPGQWALELELPGEPIAQSCEVEAGAVSVLRYWECGAFE